jgi:hypothetical protein
MTMRKMIKSILIKVVIAAILTIILSVVLYFLDLGPNPVGIFIVIMIILFFWDWILWGIINR